MLQKGKMIDQRSYQAVIWTAALFVLFMFLNLLSQKLNINISNAIVQNYSTVFISIILETMPFILLGAFISSLIQVFISEQLISRLIPRNRFVGLFAASLMGLIFPVCECAIIPIGRRLIKKGVPTGIAVTFMLAVPIVNPIVLLSTYYAFINKPYMVLIRGVLGLICAVLIGFITGWFEEGKNPLKSSSRLNGLHMNYCSCDHHHEHSHNHDHDNHSHNHHGHSHMHDEGILQNKHKIVEIIDHTSSEFYDIGKYLIFGSVISAGFQTIISRGSILAVGHDKNISVIVMILFAFIISLCSEADAFVARSFMGQFTTGSIAAFLIFGPMLDIKNTLMLNAVFKKRFILQLMLIIFLVCFIAGIIVNNISI